MTGIFLCLQYPTAANPSIAPFIMLSFATFLLVGTLNARCGWLNPRTLPRHPIQSRLFVLEKDHSSLPDTLNHGHFFARGRYLTWVSADNVHYKDFLSTLVSVLNDYVETGIAISDHKYGSEMAVHSDGAARYMFWQKSCLDLMCGIIRVFWSNERAAM
jgi:cellulose synthase/poly-beta-1,6-N-acetylglucosamine synthase-like glycosyltransferase